MFKLGTQLGAGASVHFPATLNMSDKKKHLGRFLDSAQGLQWTTFKYLVSILGMGMLLLTDVYEKQIILL